MNVNARQNKLYFRPQIYATVLQPWQFISRCCFLSLLLLFSKGLSAQQSYVLAVRWQDSSMAQPKPELQQQFSGRDACMEYIQRLPSLLQAKGYVTASIDSIQSDSSAAIVYVYAGRRYQWKNLLTDSVDASILSSIGYRERQFTQAPLNFNSVQQLQQRLLQFLENSGYPFATVWLDDFLIQNDSLSARMMLRKGPLYRIDSIRVFGEVNIRNRFLQRYLEIPSGSIFQRNQLQQISRRLLLLPYLQEEDPWNLSMLGTGAILNLYLRPKRSSQLSGLLGFLPANDQLGGNRMLVTGDFNLQLRNPFGNGEALGVTWQQIQVQSPRLQLRYEQPFMLGTAFGSDFNFELFKKDSSFLNLNFRIGLQYAFGGNRSGRIFYHAFSTTLLTIDTAVIRSTRRLPEQIDQRTTQLGIDYEWFNTGYRLNPRKGSEVKFTGMAGIRSIRQNNNISNISDPLQPGKTMSSLYDSLALRASTFRLKLQAAHFFKTGKQTTLKTALQAGWVESPLIFRNELFQIGGFKTLRGFDEESIFASQYGIATAEYRVLTGLNSYLFAFADLGWARNYSKIAETTNRFFGSGLGISFENKAGVFNLAFAVGKRNDLPMNLRQAKIHFGYVNFF